MTVLLLEARLQGLIGIQNGSEKSEMLIIRLLLKPVKSSIFGSKLSELCILTRSTAECFRDKLPIFTPATLTYNYPVNRFISDTNKSTASLKVLESLSDKCKLPTSCTLTSHPKYHHVFVFDCRKIRKIKLLECCKRERRPTISQKISLPIQSPFNKKKCTRQTKETLFRTNLFRRGNQTPT